MVATWNKDIVESMRFVLKLVFIAFLAAIVLQQLTKSDAPESRSKVSSPTTVIAPAVISAPASPPQKAKTDPLRVQIKAQSDGAEQPMVSGTTNLPDGSSLMISIRRPQAKYFAQATTTVLNGAFTAGPFSARGAPVPPGEYEIDVTFPLAFTQSPAVQEVVGRDNENLTGPLVVKSNLGVTAELKTKVKVGGAVSAKADAKSRADSEAALKRWKEESALEIKRMVEEHELKFRA